MSLAVLPSFPGETEFADSATGLLENPLPDSEPENDEGTAGVFKLSLVADARNSLFTREQNGFCPKKPASLEAAGLSRDFTEKLICKYLHVHGISSGRTVARDLGLPYRLIEPLLSALKTEMMLIYRKTVAAGDYELQLTEAGDDRARRFMSTSTYAESAPVQLEAYVESVAAQSLTLTSIGMDELSAAFGDLALEPDMMARLGPAINAGRGMFLHGAPGNGKTSIAERVARCFGTSVWIPKTLMIDGECVRLFDPVLHEPVADEESCMLGEPLEDARWIRVKRPTVVVGGELTMDQLEMRHDPVSNVCEAPLQMKSNCGVLLVDDFGRQAMPVDQLLNRWIVPLEKRYDFQKLPSGKKIQVPFDQLVIFSTNLAPRDLVDEAFLRRLPYKVEARDPTPQQFCKIAMHVAPSLGVHVTPVQILSMIERYFLATGRPMRCCHPRDLLLQVRSYCRFHRLPLEMTEESMEFAVENYFTVM
jgi:hypothetical protein